MFMNLRVKCLLIINCLMVVICATKAQCPNADFILSKKSICIDEKLVLNNASTSFDSISWDFCSGDNLNKLPNSNELDGDFGATNYSKFITDKNEKYSFVTGFVSDKLYRLDFGNSILNVPIFNDLGDLGVLDDPMGIVLKKEMNKWYAIVAGYNNNLYRLEFGESLKNTPNPVDISGTLNLNRPMGVEMVMDEGNIFVFVVNNANSTYPLLRLNFGNSILNTPTVDEITIPGSRQLSTLSFGRSCDQWYGFIVSRATREIFRMDFGDSPSNNPVITEVGGSSGLLFNDPGGIDVVSEANKNYVFVTSRNGPLYRLDFGDSFLNNPTGLDLGNINSAARNWGIEFIKESSDWYALLSNFGGELYRFSFEGNCSANKPISSIFEPNEISYSETGTYIVSLESIDSNGDIDVHTDTVNVIDLVAPPALINTEDFFCELSSFDFFGDSNEAISDWQWNFGDGSTAAGQNVTHQYADSGVYDVVLEISADNGCSNFARKKIPIYLPPESSFDYPSGILCSNSPISFSNTTNFTGPDSILSFNWNFDGMETSQEENPTFNFSTGGIKNVSLTTSIPGCADDSIRTVNITEGPNTQFSFTGTCEYEIFEFDNLTTGTDVTGYKWDFGDGNFSTENEPLHLFDSGNIYDVTLQATNALGCQTTFEMSVPVRSKPWADFDNELACSENEIRFFNTSTVQNANIDTSNWLISNTEFGFEATSQEMDPEIQLADPGTYNITLRAVSNYGCSDTLTSDIEVIESPQVDYTSEIACLGAETQLMAMATPPQNGNIVSYNWIVDGALYTEPDIGHVFNTSGNKNIRLTARADNNCEQSVSRELYLPGRPNADFTNSRLCNNEPITFSSISNDDPEDPIAFYDWKINGNNLSNAETFQTNLSNAENYEVQMISYTANNCTDTISRTIQVNQAPVARIDADPLNGAPPLEVFFTNNTSFSDDFYWDFSANNDDFSTEEEPLYTYEEIGVERVSFIARNDDDCEDSTGLQINVLPPVLDLSINSVVPVQNEDRIGFVVTIENRGTVVVDQTDLKIRVNNEITLVERISERLIPGSAVNHTFDFDIINIENQSVRIVCFEINAVDTDLSDETPENNSECLDLSSSFFVFNPYPNPVNEVFTLPFIKSQEGSVTIQLISSDGKNTYEQTATGLKEGLNFIDVDVSRYASGSYLINVSDQNGGKNEVFKMIIL